MKIEFYRRTDGRLAWRLVAKNGQPIATDGGQGYERFTDLVHGARQATAFDSRGIRAEVIDPRDISAPDLAEQIERETS